MKNLQVRDGFFTSDCGAKVQSLKVRLCSLIPLRNFDSCTLYFYCDRSEQKTTDENINQAIDGRCED